LPIVVERHGVRKIVTVEGVAVRQKAGPGSVEIRPRWQCGMIVNSQASTHREHERRR
jgi:hypothetical protein